MNIVRGEKKMCKKKKYADVAYAFFSLHVFFSVFREMFLSS